MSTLAWTVLAIILANPGAERASFAESPVAPEAEPEQGSASLRGSVLVEDTGVELGEVVVELECPCLGAIERVRVDLGGEFTYAGLPAGVYRVRVRYPGGVVEQPLTLAAGQAGALALRLTPPTPLPSPPPPSVIPQRPAGDVLAHPIDEGAALRRYGLGFTVLGAVLGVGGLVAAYHNPCGKDGAVGSNCRTDVRNSVALLMGVTALGSVTGGVISMSIGQALRHRARVEAGLAWRIGTDGRGLTLSGTF